MHRLLATYSRHAQMPKCCGPAVEKRCARVTCCLSSRVVGLAPCACVKLMQGLHCRVYAAWLSPLAMEVMSWMGPRCGSPRVSRISLRTLCTWCWREPRARLPAWRLSRYFKHPKFASRRMALCVSPPTLCVRVSITRWGRAIPPTRCSTSVRAVVALAT